MIEDYIPLTDSQITKQIKERTKKENREQKINERNEKRQNKRMLNRFIYSPETKSFLSRGFVFDKHGYLIIDNKIENKMRVVKLYSHVLKEGLLNDLKVFDMLTYPEYSKNDYDMLIKHLKHLKRNGINRLNI